MVMDRWAYDNGMTMDYSRPGNPTDNPFIESFNGSFRDECTTSIAQRPMLPMSR
ncbi:TPA: transposase [Xanthomonas vasicola pv. zeae]|nr:transposase [Xanthomonas vasicola pv. zeae]